MQEGAPKHYTVTGGPKGPPVLGVIADVIRDPLTQLAHNALTYGDIIPFKILGQQIYQVNHPDLVRYVLMENHKNYRKSSVYIRFESVLGQGLLTSNGEKWRRDRQKIQPMFKREQIEGYYFAVVNEVTEKYKKRWLSLTEKGPATLDITQEMAALTLEVIVKLIFGKDALSEDDIHSLYHSACVFLEYLKPVRILPKVDFDRVFHTPRYGAFKKELGNLQRLITSLLEQYSSGQVTDRFNMMALLLAAQKEDPEHFTEQDVRDQCATMIFAGFETTSLLMQWMWYALDERPDIGESLRAEITGIAPCTLAVDSRALAYDDINKMDYLGMVFKETMRMYPSFWVTSREPIADDMFGDFKVKRGSVIVLPQIVMHRHPRFWDRPNAFIPERFTPENEALIDDGMYFPFSHGARKCSGYRLAEMEAKVVFAKLFPLFKVKVQNALANGLYPSVSLQPKHSIQVEISRA